MYFFFQIDSNTQIFAYASEYSIIHYVMRLHHVTLAATTLDLVCEGLTRWIRWISQLTGRSRPQIRQQHTALNEFVNVAVFAIRFAWFTDVAILHPTMLIKKQNLHNI